MRNAKNKTMVEFFIYKEKPRFVGVCLTFDIVVEGKNPNKIKKDLEEASRGYLETVMKPDMSEEFLTRPGVLG